MPYDQQHDYDIVITEKHGIQLPQDEDLDFQGCDVCASKPGEPHEALCPDIMDGLMVQSEHLPPSDEEQSYIRVQEQQDIEEGRDMFDFLTTLGLKLRDLSYSLEN